MNTQERYSPRTWPVTPLPVPRVMTGDPIDAGDGWYTIGWDAEGWRAGESRCETPPIEMHLREMREVDRRDPGALARLAGVTGEPVYPDHPWRGHVSPRLLPALKPAFYQKMVANIARQLDLSTPRDWSERPVLDGFHVTEVAFVATLVGLLTDHLVRALSGEPTAPVWQGAGAFDFSDFEFRLLAVPEGYGRSFGDESAEVIAWHYFSEYLNEGLEPFSARVIGPELDSVPDVHDVTSSYSAACVLIFNDLVEGLPYKRCADETCGRLFRRQLGRSAGRVYRSEGVDFCSPTHARNQAQRERRRRQRAERMEVDRG